MMRTILRNVLVLFVLAIIISPLQAQDLHPSRRLSPTKITRAYIGDTYVKIHYSAPYMRNRTIFGDLISYNEVWRTGANEATEITLTKDILVEGHHLKAGTYSLFTTPGTASWKIHFSPQLGLWDTGIFDPNANPRFTPNIYDSSKDVLVVEVPVMTISNDLEAINQLSIELTGGETSGKLIIAWERTAIPVKLEMAN